MKKSSEQSEVKTKAVDDFKNETSMIGSVADEEELSKVENDLEPTLCYANQSVEKE